MVNTEDQDGRPTFMGVLKLVTIRGVAKAGLSTHCTSYRHSVTQVNDMLLSLKYFEYVNSTDVFNEIDNISNKWKI